MVTTARESKDVVRRTFDAARNRDRDAFIELHADDAVLHSGDETIQGGEAIAEQQWAFYESFPDVSPTPDTLLAEGDLVAVRWIWTGTHERVFEGIEPTGTEVEVEEMGLFRVEDGEVVEVWLLADTFGLLQQLGVVELPGE
jgi:steroid delta-isomerase-like uncharacterized protein